MKMRRIWRAFLSLMQAAAIVLFPRKKVNAENFVVLRKREITIIARIFCMKKNSIRILNLTFHRKSEKGQLT